MDKISLFINGHEVAADPKQTILEVVHEHGLDEIPTLCHSDELAPLGSCFLCVVEIEGRPSLAPACATRVMPGMKVTTNNERVAASRRTALTLLLSNHFADCVSPCKTACPAGVDAQGYLALAAMGEYRKAIDLIRESNPLVAVCGRICVRKCEVACRRQEVDEPVAINNVKRFISDQPGAYDGTPVRAASRGKSVGVVGAGPAGLTAAWFLGRQGYDVVMYEMMPKPGGMLRYGIPEYRLPKDVLDREIEYICRAGGEIRCNTKVGSDISLAELRKKHDAVFLGAGAWAGNGMRVKGEDDTPGIVRGAEFLIEKAAKPAPVAGTVVVIGGGNTAMDVARTSWRLGAAKVIILYRRTKAEMPADRMEIRDCLDEGIEIMELAAPVGILKKDDGSLRALKCIRMKLGEPDQSGRQKPVPLEGSEFELPCDMAIPSIGQSPVLDELVASAGEELRVSKYSTFVIDTKTMKTSLEGVFAGGDAADDGPTVVIDAIRDGQRAAKSIHAFLSSGQLEAPDFAVSKEFWGKPGKKELGDVRESPRHELHEIPVSERASSFAEVASGFEPEDVSHETARCLSCGCVAFDYCKLRLYAEQLGVDMDKYKGTVRKHKIDDRHPYLVYDPNKCVLCQRCIRTCARVLPVSALGLVNRGFQTEVRPAMNDPLVETSCVACGNCVDSCPTGALTVKTAFKGRASLPSDKEETFCGFCSVGCPVVVRRISDRNYWIESPGPGEYLCHSGRFGYELFLKSRRLLEPQLREGAVTRSTTFRDAYAAAASGLREAVSKHGPAAVAVLVSPDLSNEEMYLAARIARDALGTGNVGSLTLLETGAEAGSADKVLGATRSTAGIETLRDADLVLVNNADPHTDQLVLSVGILDATRRGAKLVVVNSSPTQLAEIADLAVDPIRGRGNRLWQAVIQSLVDDGFFPRDRVASMKGGAAFLAGAPERECAAAGRDCGIPADRILAIANLIRNAPKTVIVHSPDRSRDMSAGDTEALADLAALLVDRGSQADILLVSASANGTGVEIAGADPAFMSGRAKAPNLPGARTRSELLALLRSGAIRAALVVGEDPMGNDRTAAYFAGLEFLVAVDWTHTETTGFANVALPGSTFLESEGTRCNFAGRVQAFNAVVTPPSGIKGWQVLQNLAGHLGLELSAVFGRLSAAIEHDVRRASPQSAELLWNTGGIRPGLAGAELIPLSSESKPGGRVPALNAAARYRRDANEIRLDRFRVGAKRV